MIRKIVGWYNKRALPGSQRSCVKYVLIYGLRMNLVQYCTIDSISCENGVQLISRYDAANIPI